MRTIAAIFFLLVARASAIAEGDLQFTLNGKTYLTHNAQAIVETKRGKTRIHIAVKDVTEKFMLMLTAELTPGQELSPLQLTTENSTLSVSLRTKQGTFAVMPHTQLAPITEHTYTERVLVETSELEDDMHVAPSLTGVRPKRKKIRSEYRKVKPRWHTMSKEDRLKHGEGVIVNSAFKDALFMLSLQPVVSAGKVVSLDGTFGGTGRLGRGMSGNEIKPIQNGSFRVRVQYAP